jgi:hypothetical protein
MSSSTASANPIVSNTDETLDGATSRSQVATNLGKRKTSEENTDINRDSVDDGMQIDTSVGIAAFMDDRGETPRTSFQGTIKERWSDFIVHEVSDSVGEWRALRYPRCCGTAQW